MSLFSTVYAQSRVEMLHIFFFFLSSISHLLSLLDTSYMLPGSSMSTELMKNQDLFAALATSSLSTDKQRTVCS